MTNKSHWLTQPRAIRRLWIGFAGVLALTVLAEVPIEDHGYFGIDATFGFHAWYGFVICVAMIAFAKLLGMFLKRQDTYYDE
ncbi:MAG: hypothetical protein ACREI3_03490 [Nitrospirales bacterium]